MRQFLGRAKIIISFQNLLNFRIQYTISREYISHPRRKKTIIKKKRKKMKIRNQMKKKMKRTNRMKSNKKKRSQKMKIMKRLIKKKAPIKIKKKK